MYRLWSLWGGIKSNITSGEYEETVKQSMSSEVWGCDSGRGLAFGILLECMSSELVLEKGIFRNAFYIENVILKPFSPSLFF